MNAIASNVLYGLLLPMSISNLKQWFYSGLNLMLTLICSYYLQGALDPRQTLCLVKSGLIGIRGGQ